MHTIYLTQLAIYTTLNLLLCMQYTLLNTLMYTIYVTQYTVMYTIYVCCRQYQQNIKIFKAGR